MTYGVSSFSQLLSWAGICLALNLLTNSSWTPLRLLQGKGEVSGLDSDDYRRFITNGAKGIMACPRDQRGHALP